jgi:hypothetical protein
MTAIDAINYFSRPYRHELLQVNYTPNNTPEYAVDQDFIPRRITSAVIVFEGVKAGEAPIHTIMWSALGYPACAVAIPLLMNAKYLPTYMSARGKKGDALHSEMCDASLKIKDTWVFPMKISNGKRYICLQNVLIGTANKPAILSCTNKVESKIQQDFLPLYQQWAEGALPDQSFYKWYEQITKQWMKDYCSAFNPWLTE